MRTGYVPNHCFGWGLLYCCLSPCPQVRGGPLGQTLARCRQEGRPGRSAPLPSHPLNPPKVRSGGRRKKWWEKRLKYKSYWQMSQRGHTFPSIFIAITWLNRLLWKRLHSKWLIMWKVNSFFAHYDREDIIRSMLRVHTTSSVEPCISVQLLFKVVLQVGINVLFIDLDEVVTVMPHWC